MTSKVETKTIKTHRQTHIIDATDKILGRLATEVASLLRGKDDPNFEYHMDQGGNVVVQNISKMKTTGKKMAQKTYYHHSGFPGGLKEKKMQDVFAKNPGEVLKRAVFNMLPKNKLRDRMIKRLTLNN